MRIRLITSAPPPPNGKPLTPRDVPDAFVLRAATASQREALLIGLALSYAQPPPRIDGLLDALKKVITETNAVSLTDTLEVMAKRGSLGFVLDALGLEFLLAHGTLNNIHVSDILATTDTVSRRGLTRSEARRITENFANTLDPSTVRFCFTTGVQTMGAGAMVVGNTIHVDPTDPRWGIKRGTTLPESPDDESWDSFNGVLLAHEPSHIWSYQHQGSQYAINSVADQLVALQSGDRSGAYFYKPDKPHFLNYGEEQRAMIVQDYVTAFRGKAKGEKTTLTMFGGSVDIDDALKVLERFITQMRAMGPGISAPIDRQPEWILCACPRPGITQDGVAGFLGAQGSALIGAAGRASTQGLVDGVTKKDVGLVAAGLAGVAGAAVISVLPREQGAASGGSAVLDQAGIPHGVELEKDGVSGSVKLNWDAPDGDTSGPGFKDARVEWGAGVHREVGDVRVDANAKAVIATTGQVREVSGTAKVGVGPNSLEVGGGVEPQRSLTLQRAWAHVELVTDPVTIHVGGNATSRDGVIKTANIDTRVETKNVSVTTDVQLGRIARDAPLAVTSATVGVTGQFVAGASAGVGVTVAPGGVDAVNATIAATGNAGSVSVSADATKLLTTPTVGATITATDKKSGVAVAVNAQTTPSTGEVKGGVTFTVPLPDPGKK